MSDSSVSCEQERPSCLKPDSSATLCHMTPYPADTRASITFPPYCGIYMNGQKIPDWIFFRFSILFPIGLFGMGQLLEGGMGKQNGREVGGRGFGKQTSWSSLSSRDPNPGWCHAKEKQV